MFKTLQLKLAISIKLAIINIISDFVIRNYQIQHFNANYFVLNFLYFTQINILMIHANSTQLSLFFVKYGIIKPVAYQRTDDKKNNNYISKKIINIFNISISVFIYQYYLNSIRQMKMVSWMWKGKEKQKEKQKEEEEVDQDELKKKGFNPEGLQIQEVKQEPIMDFDKDYQGFVDPTPEQLAELVNSLKFFPNDQQPRHELGHSKGGKICGDKKQVSKIRSIGKQMIKLIGKKIISGDLNLTRISFPIKAMVPKTALQNSTLGCCTMPYFLKKACESNSPLQKMKYVLTSIISSSYYMNLFLKPLNPVIGQTLEGSYADGTQIYCQQISHHPPISYFLVIGPNQTYKYAGYYAFQANAGLNSMTLTNKGRRWFEFADGTRIDVNFNKQTFAGVFMGSLRSEAIGSFILKDQKNELQCEVKYGKVKKKPSDYFEGSILQKGKSVSKFYGTYCGFIDFDGVRYWDGRGVQGVKIRLEDKPLQSDFRNRNDLKRLADGKIQQAQEEKQKIQEMQRRDAKLRQQFKNK